MSVDEIEIAKNRLFGEFEVLNIKFCRGPNRDVPIEAIAKGINRLLDQWKNGDTVAVTVEELDSKEFYK